MEWYYKWSHGDYRPLPPISPALFHATHRDARATIYWHLDGEYLGETTEFHFIEARPSAGRHLITIVDGSGEELTREFVCLSEK
jgi:penicillin-binding protein 1C